MTDWDASEGISRSRTDPPTWDILIASIVHRTGQLTELLHELGRQILQAHTPSAVGVRVFRDNLETQYGDKCQILLDSSDAEYVSWFDDDDWPAEDFVPAIMKALKEHRPDYVGFNVHFTEDGVYQVPVIHSLQYPGWHGGFGDNGQGLTRDIVHFNPIRRELAVQGHWEGWAASDVRWADQLRALGCVKTEVYFDRDMYFYRHVGGQFSVPPRMMEPPPQPDVPWVTWLT